jgi:16S rRNA (cytidine1402-2'-O)-methyltransferase
MTGTLFIVATPIGNLEDITLRALRALREADLIACEDTRQTRKLLDHASISKPTVSYHDHNESARAAELIAKLQAGMKIALVSDAGTPLISDPGYRLVAAAIDAGIPVVPIPGACAAVTALSASGLPPDSFRFCGFLPPKSSQRRKFLEDLKLETGTLIFYEAPHRAINALDDIAAVMGDRRVVVARELTKIHEEFLRGTAAEIRAQLGERAVVRGEITILVGKREVGQGRALPVVGQGHALPGDAPIEEAVRALERQGLSRMDAIKHVAKDRGIPKREVYRLLMS